MNTFKSIDDLLRVLEREKVLMKQMFQKRPSTSLKYDYALELTEYKEERVKYLIDYGVIRDSGNFLEMEDVYLKFFEEVLKVEWKHRLLLAREQRATEVQLPQRGAAVFEEHCYGDGT